MYTHVFVSPEDAKLLFIAFARRPLRPGEVGVVTGATLEEHFAECSQTYLAKLAAMLEQVRSEDLFVLKFDRYLPHLPVELLDMGIVPAKVEIVRFNSAPTSARAGYYEVSSEGLTATVERIVPTQHDRSKPAGVYAQNIRVSGPSLEAVQEFHSKLCEGLHARALVNAFE